MGSQKFVVRVRKKKKQMGPSKKLILKKIKIKTNWLQKVFSFGCPVAVLLGYQAPFDAEVLKDQLAALPADDRKDFSYTCGFNFMWLNMKVSKATPKNKNKKIKIKK